MELETGNGIKRIVTLPTKKFEERGYEEDVFHEEERRLYIKYLAVLQKRKVKKAVKLTKEEAVIELVRDYRNKVFEERNLPEPVGPLPNWETGIRQYTRKSPTGKPQPYLVALS